MGILVNKNGPTRLLKILSDEELLWDNRIKSKGKSKSKTGAKSLSKGMITTLEYISCKKQVKAKRNRTKLRDRDEQAWPAPAATPHGAAAESERDGFDVPTSTHSSEDGPRESPPAFE